MRIVVKKQDVVLIAKMSEMGRNFSSGAWRVRGMRAIIDAGRKTKTQVQRSVRDQMNLAPGYYSSYVVANTRGTPYQGRLTYEIYGVKGGQRLEHYKGLLVLSRTGAAAKRGNAGRGAADAGSVRSAVWNASRVFKRSFGTPGGTFATLPGKTSSKAPRALWTYGAKPNQPRDASGKFGKSSARYGRIRPLAGPSLMKEIPKGQSLATFQRVAPVFLEQAAIRQLTPLMKF